MSTRIRVGIVGHRGLAFASGLRALPQVDLCALCDIDAIGMNRTADEHDIKERYTRFDDLLENVDAVVVSTPMQLHASQSIRALEAGKHVLSEVTAAVSLDECWRLRDAAQKSGAVYMLSENYCYIRDNVLVREMARQGLFGDLYFGEGEYLHDTKYLHHHSDGSPTWRYYWQVGVNGCTYPTHSVGPVMQWFQAADADERIESVACFGTGRHTDREHPHDDTTLTICKLASGKLVKIRVDLMSNRPHQMTYYSLQGTHGVYEASRIDTQRGHVWIGENPPPGPTDDAHRNWRSLAEFEEHLPEHWRHPPDAALEAGHGGGDYWVVSDWVRAIENGAPPPIDIYTGLEWTAVGLCSQISIDNGGALVKVPNFRDDDERPLMLDAPPIVI